jgi:hypothetical protein
MKHKIGGVLLFITLLAALLTGSGTGQRHRARRFRGLAGGKPGKAQPRSSSTYRRVEDYLA